MRILLLLLFCLFGQVTDSLAFDQWIQHADFGSIGRHRAIAIAVANKVYAGTGHYNGTGTDYWIPDWWEYDPGTNAWAQKADYIGHSGLGDQDLTAICIDNIAYIGLGQWSDYSHYKYDPATNIWTQLNDAPSASFSNTCPFVINGKGYFPQAYSTNFYEYDPVADTWTPKAAIPVSVSHRDPTFVLNDKGYFKHNYELYEYDPTIDTWTPKAAFPGSTPYNPVGVSQYGYGFMIGGYLTWGNSSGEVWRYDAVTDSWLRMEDFPGTHRRWAVYATLGDRVYFGLGTNGTNMNDWWEYNSVGGLDDFKVESFKAYPTLADDHVQFTSEDVMDFEIRVMNMQGQQVADINAMNGTAMLERNGLADGTYLYHVLINGTSVHSDRFVFN